MAKFRLGPAGIAAIEDEIDKLFDAAKVRFLGPHTVGKRIYVTYDRPKALAGIYETATKLSGATPDTDVLKGLITVAENYLESARLRTKSRLVSDVQAVLAEAEAKGGVEASEIAEYLQSKISQSIGEATTSVRQIIEAETNKAKNISIFDSIMGINRAVGVDDPTVYFVVVHDEALCKECKRLHLLEDGITPRLWYMSEVSHSYHSRKDDSPSVHGLHPSCRCTIVTLPPGMGFGAGGNTVYVSPTHKEIEKQRGGSDE